MVKRRKPAEGSAASESVDVLRAKDGENVAAQTPRRKRPRAEASNEDVSGDKQPPVDNTAVFIRGIPPGAIDAELRRWLETQAGPTVTCYRIRGDYGLAKFKDETGAKRCLEELKGVEFEGSVLQFETAKPKRRSVQQRSTSSTAPATQPGGTSATRESGLTAEDEGAEKPSDRGLDLREVLLKGIPAGIQKTAMRAWVEERLPGGCGLEDVRRISGSDGVPEAFVLRFKKEANARRAVETLQGAKFQSKEVSAGFRALEMSRQSAKGGRLIVRNLAFGATEKHVRKEFAKLGELTEVHLPPKQGDKGQGGNPAHRGFAFVQYADSSFAERAVAELNGVKICGRGVAVDWAVDAKLYGSLKQEEERPQRPKKGDKADVETGRERKDTQVPEAPAKKEEEDEDDEESDEEEEDDEDDEEEEAETGKGDEAASELRRMREMLGDDADEAKPEEKKDKVKKGKEKDDKAQKALRTPGYDVSEGRTLFVRNCPFDATEAEVRQTFSRFGKVASVKLVADKTGQHEHTGSVFIKFREAEGLQKALSVEDDANRKLKELASVIKKSDQRELPAVEGFGVALRGRRLVLKQALTPAEMQHAVEEKKPEKGAAAKERSSWMHLLHVGEINEHHDGWEKLGKSEKKQRQQSMKERKFRVNNSNFAIHPLRLSVRNLPRAVDATKMREVLVSHLADQSFLEEAGNKKQRRRKAQDLVQKVGLVRDEKRKDSQNERRSRGFGFISFKDHRSALAALEKLNDNPDVFGGGKRPIVEFAIEDKRKLRMQEDLYSRHAYKLLGNKAEDKNGGKEGKGKGKGKGEAADAQGKGGKGEGEKGKGKGKGKSGDEGQDRRKTFKHKKKAGESRGRKQREKKRALKAAAEEKAQRKDAFEAKMQSKKEVKSRANAEKRLEARKRQKRFEPDLGPASKKVRTQRPGELSDDFELRALERFRAGKK